MTTSRISLFVILSLISCYLFTFAQDVPRKQRFGQLEGLVTDLSTGTPLIGANVIIEGTSLGSATDQYGKYSIPRVPTGSYTLVVSYIGYQNVKLEIDVPSGETSTYNVSLAFHYVEGEVVTITAQASGQMQAINEQLSARTIKNIVAAERIRELPDENAATALSRLPGVSLQDGDKVVIRGVQAKMILRTDYLYIDERIYVSFVSVDVPLTERK